MFRDAMLVGRSSCLKRFEGPENAQVSRSCGMGHVGWIRVAWGSRSASSRSQTLPLFERGGLSAILELPVAWAVSGALLQIGHPVQAKQPLDASKCSS